MTAARRIHVSEYLAGLGKRPRRPRVSTVNTETRRTNSPGPWCVTLTLRTSTKGNGSHGHIFAAAAKTKRERAAARNALYGAFGAMPPSLPLVITLTRVSAGRLDMHSVGSALKAVQDGVADWLGLRNDECAGLTWCMAQTKGPRGTHRVDVRIERAEET